MRIATWNVNSISQRMENLQAWLAERAPDIVCLQEIKCVDEAFPREAFEALGYNVAVHGQKTFNGVAIALQAAVRRGCPRAARRRQRRAGALPRGDRLHQAGRAAGASASICPMATRPNTEKYPYKLNWMERLIAFSRERLKLEEPFVLAGDYNVIPAAADAHNPAAWVNDALFLPQTREKFRALTNLGLTDAIRAASDEAGLYTFWDYQAGAWQRTTASASITCCCRRRPPTGSPMPASTSMSAAGTSRPTTCRSGSIWISRGADRKKKDRLAGGLSRDQNGRLFRLPLSLCVSCANQAGPRHRLQWRIVAMLPESVWR